ncbi:hypothetical protein QFZ63_000014 [Streptomyces sp. B3I7]|nr:hypothetical protein [Streptomyces sp. B3I7]
MTDVSSDIEAGEAAVGATGTVDDGLVAELVARAQAGGVRLTGEGGLLQQLTKRVLESALEGELTDHLGHERGERAEGGRENYRNGHRSRTVVTESGPVEIAVPRDRAGAFEPQLVKKRQRRLGGVDEMVLSLSAKGLTHGEISAHLAEVYGAEISKSTISTITDSVMAGTRLLPKHLLPAHCSAQAYSSQRLWASAPHSRPEQGGYDMRSIGRFTAWATTLATTASAAIVLAGSPASADDGGYWAWQCDYGRACLHLSGVRHAPGGGDWWNANGCGFHQIGDYYDRAVGHGNSFVVYIDDRWDRVNAWTTRSLDPTNLATNVYVECF